MADPLSPDWWLDRLYGTLRGRQKALKDWDALFSGDHPAPAGYEKAGPVLVRLLEAANANFLAMLVHAAQERMTVDGYKIGGKASDDLWAIHQGNNLDRATRQVFLEHMALGRGYMLVDPTENAAGFPTVTAEHPSQCAVERDPGRQVTVAGLKVWHDDLGDKPLTRAMLYLPDAVLAYAAPARPWAESLRWSWALKPRWELQRDLSGANELGEVPLVEFENRPRLLKQPRPEWWPAWPTQQRVNKTLLDRLAMQDSGAFKAMWASGLKIPVNPATGEPVEDFVKAIDRMFVNENPDGKFGQFEAEDIRMMLDAVDADAKHMAALVPTPPDYLLGTMVNVSAEGLKAAQASLTSRVREHQSNDETPLEDVGRMALKATGETPPAVSSMTTVWRNPEFRTEGELVDALLKMATLGVPREALWERWGATPQEVAAWKRMALDEAAADPLLAAAAGGPAPAAQPSATPDAVAGAVTGAGGG